MKLSRAPLQGWAPCFEHKTLTRVKVIECGKRASLLPTMSQITTVKSFIELPPTENAFPRLDQVSML
jgi:hypothetical protein